MVRRILLGRLSFCIEVGSMVVMGSLFEQAEATNFHSVRPLAARMRPVTLEEFLGQDHFLGEGKLLRRLLKSDRLTSVLFYGPPGTGKTTLAQLLASASRSKYEQLNAVTSGVKELRQVLESARDEVATSGRRTLLFVDEIHRFNKAQQDALLPDVEEGIVILVGATTANPFFAVNSSLVSRSHVFQFEPLSTSEIHKLLIRAIEDEHRGLGKLDIHVHKGVLQYLAEVSDGDARRALGALEVAVLSSDKSPVELSRELAAESVQRKTIQYDADGDAHYDCASALIKSMRGSDPDAALYWLARMLEAGEDVRFLTRRIVIFASEDVGNADPQSLSMAVACMHACEFVGLPECQLNLAQTVTYLACAPKSNAVTVGIAEARHDVRENQIVPVPKHLRDSHYKGAQSLGHGEGYQYAHNEQDGIAAQEYLGIEREYYRPVSRGYETELLERLKVIREKLRSAKS